MFKIPSHCPTDFIKHSTITVKRQHTCSTVTVEHSISQKKKKLFDWAVDGSTAPVKRPDKCSTAPVEHSSGSVEHLFGCSTGAVERSTAQSNKQASCLIIYQN